MGSKNVGDQITRAIDKAYEEDKGGEQRSHLGASVLGSKCAREVWYKFRWAYIVQHTGRMLRLFERGHDEEHRIKKWLTRIGVTVEEVDPETGKQFLFSEVNGHFGGSCDGKLYGLEAYGAPPGPGLLEDKTHNEKSFKDVEKKGVTTSKLSHFIQMQVYMQKFKLAWALYFPVCKNDDHINPEIIHAKPEVASYYSDRAAQIVESRFPPPRITRDKSWFVCKFCDFREICHYDKPMAKSCRTCIHSEPVLDDPSLPGEWRCTKFQAIIPKDFAKVGCDAWEQIDNS